MALSRKLWIAGSVLAICLAPLGALAGTVELSSGFSFSRSNYAADNFTWQRRWGASVGYYLGDKTEVELSFQDVVERNKLGSIQDITFHDQVFSANWVQSFTGRNFPVQPYVKIGIGQLFREYSGNFGAGAEAPAAIAVASGVLGAGLRIYLTRTFAIRTEITSYLYKAHISTWKDNFGYTAGISFMY